MTLHPIISEFPYIFYTIPTHFFCQCMVVKAFTLKLSRQVILFQENLFNIEFHLFYMQREMPPSVFLSVFGDSRWQYFLHY